MLAALLITVLIQGTGAVDYVPDTGARDQCQYKVTMTAPVDCSITDSDLRNAVSLMKQDIDMTRLSTVSLNSAIQKQIASLEDGVEQLSVDIKDIKSSQNAVRLTPDANRPGDELNEVRGVVSQLEERLSSLMDNVEDQVMYMQKYMSVLNSTITGEKVERFRVESNLQTQVNQVLEGLDHVKERISKLEEAVPDLGK
ncbi:hypothetical protein EGW08_004216 [Elysia chlorotica]|uniref:Secreted protein n=1 Tax=Elysia chlorotica TaxID=188477 RepID=A0A3S1BGV6_ELYCH|nr:hypothetical protein EGW08_004216 [Elysia chlorotica]